MPDPTIVAKATNHIVDYFRDAEGNALPFHNLARTLSIKGQTVALADSYQLEDTEQEVLLLASLFLETGFIHAYQEPYSESCKLARTFLEKHDYPHVDQVETLIQAAASDQPPGQIHPAILWDAARYHLGEADLRDQLTNWLKESNAQVEEPTPHMVALKDWIDFLKEFTYQTNTAREWWGDAVKRNYKRLKKRWKKQRKKAGALAVDKSIISGNRPAQMMFKTALRNHIDLTNIADNKANIMLSINALIITITMPLLASHLRENMLLLIPTSILLITCVLSIIYATLATRPIKTSGNTDISQIKSKPSNLFFFGNFYEMQLDAYKEGIRQIIADDELLDNTIMTDLFFLGKALGRKFNRLRTCYAIFMVGITLTVVAFAVTFFF
jgi:hypothetical protein